jgi:hypothetical protein
MGSELIHPLSPRLPCPPEGDDVEPIATLANLPEPGIPLDPALQQLTLALGNRGSYLVEAGIRLQEDGYRDFEPRGIRRYERFAALLHEGLDDA